MVSAWRASPREVDLLSWFTGPLVPIALGGIASTFAIALTVDSAGNNHSLLWSVVSTGIVMLAFAVVAVFASPRRLKITWVMTIVPMSLGMIAHGIVVASEWGSTEPFELRWSPIALALILTSLAPYLSALRLLVVGTVSSGLVMVITALNVGLSSHPDQWPTFAQPILASAIVIIATAASTVFSFQVVARTQRWATSAAGDELSSGVLGEAARRKILRQELASVSDRVLPLLERVVASGTVTDVDRAEASVLSESLRAELVERSNRSWLDSHARRLSLTVIDHERLAERMNPVQRSALLGLLSAATGQNPHGSARIVVELRAEADGATAVAISADQMLPEGRRLTMLAPHYVTLVAAVDDVEWDTSQSLHISFRVRAREGETSSGVSGTTNEPDA